MWQVGFSEKQQNRQRGAGRERHKVRSRARPLCRELEEPDRAEGERLGCDLVSTET